MIRLNTPIESIVINLQSAGEVNYNIQYVFVRNGVTLNKSVEGILTTSGQHVVLINDYSSGYFDITYLNITNIDPAQNYISVLKKTNVNETNLTSEAIGLKNRECIEFTSDSGFKTLDQNGSFKTITSSVSADGDVENSDMSYMATVPSGGSLTLPDSDIEVNGVPEGVVVSVKTISVDLNDGVNPVSPTLVTLVGNTLTITLPDIGDVTIENSDATYSVVEPSGGTLVLPDSQINVNSVDQGDVVSVKAINVNLTDGVNPVVPTSVGLVGNTLTITLPASSDVDIEINGLPYDTITAPATVDIPVINTTPVPVGTIVGTDVVVGDSTVNVRKSDATLISAVTVVAEGVASYSVADSTAVIKDSVGTTLKSEGILAATSENITINNSTVNIRNTAATLLHAVSVRAEATTTQDIADTTVDNSNASYSVNVLAEGSLTLPDQQINVNSVDEGDIPSVGTIDIDLSDGVNPVTPTSVTITGRTIDIVVPSGGVVMEADFSADILVAEVGETITFTDLTDNSPTDWAWDFNGQGESFLQNPTFEFDSLGFKDITLIAAKDGAGDTITKSSYIEVVQDPIITNFLSATSISDATIISALTKLVYDLRVNNLLSKFTAIYPFVGGTATTHKFNLLNPADTNAAYRLVFSGGWTHSSLGAKPNGTNASADTFLAPNVFGQNDVHASVYIFSNIIQGLAMDYASSRDFYFSADYVAAGLGLLCNVNNTGTKSISTAGAALSGYYINTRLSSTQRVVYKNGNLLDTFTATSLTPLSTSIKLALGEAGEYSPRGQSFTSFGSGLTSGESLILNTIVSDFQQTLGRRL